MATYNIEMNTLNSSGTYDQLFPRTYLSNVLDWSNTIYSKTEVDNIQSSLNSRISSLETITSDISDVIDSGLGKKTLITSTILNGSATYINLRKPVSEYAFIFVWLVNNTKNNQWVDFFSYSSFVSMYVHSNSRTGGLMFSNNSEDVMFLYNDDTGITFHCFEDVPSSNIYVENRIGGGGTPSSISIYFYGL